MNLMEWAKFSLDYLSKARRAVHEEFNATMSEVREYGQSSRGVAWYHTCKDIMPHLYHYSMEFTDDQDIPGSRYSSPEDFERRLGEYEAFVGKMLIDLEAEANRYMQDGKFDGPPWLVGAVHRQAAYIKGAIDYVLTLKPTGSNPLTAGSELELVQAIAARFRESVLALRQHPHGGKIFEINNEWDCQYLFRSILAGYFRDIRIEEWNPSVAGSSSRCEFFLKPLRVMVELKYVRKSSDHIKIKKELLNDFADYGANQDVDFVVVLIYDPDQKLDAAVAIQKDLSGPTKGLTDVRVIFSPPR